MKRCACGCRRQLKPKATGRPRKYWSDACKQRAYRKRLNKPVKSGNDEWATPQDVFNKLNAEFSFDLDPCATAANAKCLRYFTEEDDGLVQPWTGRVFANPPYLGFQSNSAIRSVAAAVHVRHPVESWAAMDYQVPLRIIRIGPPSRDGGSPSKQESPPKRAPPSIAIWCRLQRTPVVLSGEAVHQRSRSSVINNWLIVVGAGPPTVHSGSL